MTGAFHPTAAHLLVLSPGVVRIHTLDLRELIDIAEQGLSRAMTADECDAYGLEC